jgi:hypothetical protein
MTQTKEHLMDTQTAAVDGRIDDLRRLSAELHLERETARAKPPRKSSFRIALGRRLVSFGTSLLGEPDGAAAVAARR